LSALEDSETGEVFRQLERRREMHQRKYHAGKPKPIGNIVSRLVQQRGYAQVRSTSERDETWRAVVGEELSQFTEVVTIRRGTLEVLVANSLLMQELTFRKEELLGSLQEALPDAGIKQLRLRVGAVDKRKN